MIMILKKQPWMMFKQQVFSMINSSSFSSSSSSGTISFNNVLRRRRPFCSSSTTTNTITVSNKSQQQQQQQQHNRLLEKKHPLLIVPYNHVTPTKYLLRRPYRILLDDYGSYTCDGNLGFINLFHDDDDDQLKKKEEEEEVYNVYLPELEERRICGSSEGWLATVHENGEFQLLNPVTRDLVHLPPWSPFPGPALPPNFFHRFPRDSFIYKVITNTTTNSTTLQPAAAMVVVMAIYDHYGGLAFCRTEVVSSASSSTTVEQVGKASTPWIAIPMMIPVSAGLLKEEDLCKDISYEIIEGVTHWLLKHTCWVDVTFYKGNFYAVGPFGFVGVVKGLDGPSPFAQFLINEPETEPEYLTHMSYLVESFSASSSSGDGDHHHLLMVRRNIEEEDAVLAHLLGVAETEEEEETEEEVIFKRPYRTTGFKVWKLDLNGPAAAASWGEGVITDLGKDYALFVGYNHSFSFDASKIPGCKGNCIYFTDNHQDRIACYPDGGHDIGVYNLEDASFEKLNETCSSSQIFMPPPLWYVPVRPTHPKPNQQETRLDCVSKPKILNGKSS